MVFFFFFFFTDSSTSYFFFFFFNDTATTEIYTLSLHDALPICLKFGTAESIFLGNIGVDGAWRLDFTATFETLRESTEIGRHTSELQSQSNLVCRLLLEKKKKNNKKG